MRYLTVINKNQVKWRLLRVAEMGGRSAESSFNVQGVAIWEVVKYGHRWLCWLHNTGNVFNANEPYT